jgi:hypothetical protein
MGRFRDFVARELPVTKVRIGSNSVFAARPLAIRRRTRALGQEFMISLVMLIPCVRASLVRPQGQGRLKCNHINAGI